MSRFIGFVFATCFLAIWTSTSVPAANPDWPKSLTVGAAGPGGVFYVYGEELTRILTEKLGIAASIAPSQGSIHNIQLIERGDVQLGMISMGTGLQGWNGTGDWTKGVRFRNMRALFPMYDTLFQAFVLRRSGITALAQLDQKRVAVGPRAGTGGTYIPAILKLLGIAAENSYGSFDAMTAELFAGRLDAFTTLTGAPMPAAQESRGEGASRAFPKFESYGTVGIPAFCCHKSQDCNGQESWNRSSSHIHRFISRTN
jgi:TRAP transporter TAXI family solute receptor